jgi:hypothetical protein
MIFKIPMKSSANSRRLVSERSNKTIETLTGLTANGADIRYYRNYRDFRLLMLVTVKPSSASLATTFGHRRKNVQSSFDVKVIIEAQTVSDSSRLCSIC